MIRPRIIPWKRLLLGMGVSAVAAAFLFVQAGALLVVADPFDRAEVALVLSGGPLDRILTARDLYRQGRADRIWVIEEPPSYGPIQKALAELGLEGVWGGHWPRRILEASQVPPEKITYFPYASSTIGEARLIREHLRALEDVYPKQLVLVSAKTHTRRARFLFRWILRERPVEILAYPSPYDSFQPGQWWTRRKDALRVLDEYVKLAANTVELIATRP